MPPNSKKRSGGRVQDNLRGNVIAPTPKKKPRSDPDFETPRRVKTRDGVAVIPESDTAASDKQNESNVDSSLLVSPPVGRAPRRQNRARALNNQNARRVNNNGSPEASLPLPVTPAQGGSQSKTVSVTPSPRDANKQPAAKRRLIFGRAVDVDESKIIETRKATKRVYAIVNKLTGKLGGNGSSGPIYGELTQGSMQKMINLMKEHTQLDSRSRFIDVGSGIGKPNLHVTQDPGVAFSCGIEMELNRWILGLKCLEGVLAKAETDADDDAIAQEDKLRYNCMFLHENIMNAKTLDPFTHVYMFSIGFPPKLWAYLSEAWNRSRSPYMICYAGPKMIIDCYEFQVKLLAQTPTSMHASGESHMAYIYQRTGLTNGEVNEVLITKDEVEAYIQDAPCDKVFEQAKRQVESGLDGLKKVVDQTVAENWVSSGRRTRSEARRHGVEISKI